MRELKDNHIFLGMWLVWSLVLAFLIFADSIMARGNKRIEIYNKLVNVELVSILAYCRTIHNDMVDEFLQGEDNHLHYNEGHSYVRRFLNPIRGLCDSIDKEIYKGE